MDNRTRRNHGSFANRHAGKHDDIREEKRMSPDTDGRPRNTPQLRWNGRVGQPTLNLLAAGDDADPGADAGEIPDFTTATSGNAGIEGKMGMVPDEDSLASEDADAFIDLGEITNGDLPRRHQSAALVDPDPAATVAQRGAEHLVVQQDSRAQFLGQGGRWHGKAVRRSFRRRW